MTLIGLDIGGSNIKIGLVEKSEVKIFKKIKTKAYSGKEIFLNYLNKIVCALCWPD